MELVQLIANNCRHHDIVGHLRLPVSSWWASRDISSPVGAPPPPPHTLVFPGVLQDLKNACFGGGSAGSEPLLRLSSLELV